MEDEKIKLVKGDSIHGREIIDYLHLIGGVDENGLNGTDSTVYYYVNPFKQFDCISCRSSCVKEAIENGTAIVVNPSEYIKEEGGDIEKRITVCYVVTISNENGVSYVNAFEDYSEAHSDFESKCEAFKMMLIPYNSKGIFETDNRLVVTIGGVKHTVQLSRSGIGMSTNVN